MSIAENIDQIRQRIQIAAEIAGRHPSEIKLIAVSKTISSELIREAISHGVVIFGENRVQETRSKWSDIERELAAVSGELHMIGHLQRNKVKDAVRLFDLIHSLDSIALAEEINHRATELGKVQRVLIEVITSGEISKSGVEPAGLDALIASISRLNHLKLEGLMTIGPLEGGTIGARESFQQLHDLRDRVGGAEILPELSMGMSQDFEIAITEGSTMVRIGTAIFGTRN
jgi:PLP dependent protein